MSCAQIRDYSGGCCSGLNQNKPARVTGILNNGYVRMVGGKFLRADGLDLTSGYANRALLPPNGSVAASVINNFDAPPLCCNN